MCIYTIPLKNVFIFDLFTMPDPLVVFPKLSTTIFPKHFWSFELKLPQVPNQLASGSDYEEITQRKRRTMWEHVNFQALSVGVDVFSILEKHCTPQFIPLFVTFLIPKSNITGH